FGSDLLRQFALRQAAAFPQLAQPGSCLIAQFLRKLSPSSLGVSIHALTSPPSPLKPARARPKRSPERFRSARKTQPCPSAPVDPLPNARPFFAKPTRLS